MQVTPKKILVAESDEIVLVLLSHVLARQSFVVRTTLDALEAEKLLDDDVYDLVLVDVKLPGGVALLRAIAERHPTLARRVIVTTPDAGIDLTELPVYAVVRKPVELDSFLETVRDCLERSHN